MQDDFALLEAVGADCAGAIAVRVEPKWPPSSARYQATTEQAIRTWVKKPASRPELRSTPGLRLSLAGAQDKLLIHLDEGRPYLCEGGAPSTVILKPSNSDRHNAIELSALNELIGMRLAAASGLPVPRTF